MGLHELTAHELAAKLAAKDVSSVEVVEAQFARIDAVEPQIDAYLALTTDVALEQARVVDEARAAGETLGPLAGVPYAAKDVLCTKGVTTTCASKILHNFVPPYDATIVSRCRDAGMPLIGKTNMDEFAMGSSTENSAFKVTRNPWDLDRIPGGSSGGSAAAVAADEAFLALGSDTGGSIRQPASVCGCVGLKPTYGRVSRYGLIAYASSLDQIGPLTKDVTDAALFQHVISGHDEMDSTASDIPVPDYASALNGDVKGMKAGIVKELMGEGIEPGVRECVEKAIQALGDLGIECEEVGLPHCDYSLPVYYIIAPAECSSNLARFDGVRYGHRTEESFSDYEGMFAKTRAEGFGPEVRLRIIKGTYVLSKGYYDAYYVKALKVRQLIRNDFDKAFERFDVLISPTSPCVAFRIGERADDPLAMKMADICTIPVNLAGIPALSLPCGLSEGLPVGLQVMGKAFDEETVLRVGYAYEQQAGWVGQKPKLAAQ
ncbi:MAG TPA: Asp-tRNA(Asn)/Glu-tRNA(Gln) amidotransferase subunit GatA [Armatimonadota bacterium]|nr:Asp-tRNA(Asn)/Glu-tRNA(Gln) amidotransferase subunit GatA [Armatimonadota bacterium]